MHPEQDYLSINKTSWNNKVPYHFRSDFYDVKGFLAGKNSLNSIELDLLGDVQGQSILHLQCHFGQDSLSLSRMGAHVTGVDLSDKAIEQARALAKQTNSDAQFVCCDVYNTRQVVDQQFDVVFSSYGTIYWLPDLDRWAAVIAASLKPNGRFVFAEFHPASWMFDSPFESIAYSYFNRGPIVETESGSYADASADLHQTYVSWNHDLGEVLSSLLRQGLTLTTFQEFDYSPYNCYGIDGVTETAPHQYQITHLKGQIPLTYALTAKKAQ